MCYWYPKKQSADDLLIALEQPDKKTITTEKK